MSRPHDPPPPEALAAAALSAFVRAHRVTAEDWRLTDLHGPGWGTRDCRVCHEPWPCAVFMEVAVRLGWPPEGWVDGVDLVPRDEPEG